MPIYLIPMTTVMNPDPERQAKYTDLLGGSWGLMDYGPEPACLVAAADPDATALAGKPDVLAFPEDLDRIIGDLELIEVQKKLGDLYIPFSWLDAGLTWRQAIRGIAGLFLYMQAYGGLTDYQPVLAADGALDVQMGTLSEAQRSKLKDAATMRRLDAKILADSLILREVFSDVVKQSLERSINLGGVTV